MTTLTSLVTIGLNKWQVWPLSLAFEADDVLRTYSINANNGKVIVNKKTKAGGNFQKSLPVLDAGQYALGKRGKGYIIINDLNEKLGAGKVIQYKKKGTLGISTKPADLNLPTTHKLLGLLLNSSQNYSMAITVETDDDPEDEFSYSTCEYHLMDAKGLVIATGNVIGSVNVNTFGFGRACQRGNTCGVLEINDPYVWTVTADGDGPVRLYSYETGDLVQLSEAITDFGITDGSYIPSKPTAITRSGMLYVIANDKVYKYKRQTIAGLSYNDSKTWLGEILWAEMQYSGLLWEYEKTDIDLVNPRDMKVYLNGVRRFGLHGFMTTGGPIRDNIEALRNTAFFDILCRGYGIQFISRYDSASEEIDVVDYGTVAIIPWGHMGAIEGTGLQKNILDMEHEMESQLPRVVEMKFQDLFRNFETNVTRSVSESSRAQTIESINSPVVTTTYSAKQIVEIVRKMRWMERNTFKFSLPCVYCRLESGDVVTIQVPFDEGYLNMDVRIISINYKMSGVLAVTAKTTSAITYAEGAAESEPIPPDDTEPVNAEASILFLMDLPAINPILETSKAFVSYATAISDTWGGCSVLRSTDEGQTYVNIAEIVTGATVGVVDVPSVVGSSLIVDESTRLQFKIVQGDFPGFGETDFWNGRGLIAYGDESSGWELLWYRDVYDLGGGENEIGYLLRGLWGTEWAIANHTPGEQIILLDTAGKTMFAPSSSIGIEYLYKALSLELSLDEADEESFTYTGANLKPWSPVDVVGVWGVSDLITMSWTRRSRFDNGWRDLVDVPLNEAYEKYEIDIMDGSTIKRTIVAYTQTATYTGVQQTADFGSPQTSIDVRIYQISDVVGRGYPIEVTLNA